MPIDSQIVKSRSLFSDGCQQEGGSGEAWLRTAGEWIKLAQSVEQRGRQPKLEPPHVWMAPDLQEFFT